MPKRTEAPCDGCGVVSDDLAVKTADELSYCPDCLRRRKEDPPITYRGRTLLLSEFELQAKHDKDLAAALKGDTIQEQIEAGRK